MRRVAASSALTLLVIGLASCASLGSGSQRAEDAIHSVASLDLTEREQVLADVAARCESGAYGRQALLMLAALRLDPRNERADPDSAALTAARHLRLEETPTSERTLAESLYAIALELGADPTLRPAWDEGPGMPAPRFRNCDEPFEPPGEPYELPVVEGTPIGLRLARLASERDSLAAAHATEVRALGARVAELEAELERIRRLLRSTPDTTSHR